MNLFLIFLLALFFSGASIIGVSYVQSLYFVFLFLKIVKLTFDNRLKHFDDMNFFGFFIFLCCILISKDFFLHYYFLGKIAHSNEELAFKLFIFCIFALLVLSPSFYFVEYLYRSDVVRTIIYIGYGLSDALALNFITKEHLKNNLNEWNYVFLMSIISIISGMILVMKEIMTFKLNNVISSLKEIKNIVTTNMILGGINLWSINYLRNTNSNFILVSYILINCSGMIFYSSYNSYLFEMMYEKKLETRNEIKKKKKRE